MEIQIKRAIKAGNSSAVILPRAWLNQEVRIELIKKTDEKILFEALEIIKNHIQLSEIIGVYLAGSYARAEEDENSDIDLLIISKSKNLEEIKENSYNILVISEELLEDKLENDLFPIGAMLIEAKPLLNSAYLESINKKVEINKKNTQWLIATTKEKISLLDKVVAKLKKSNKEKSKNLHISDKIIYTLILRIRSLYLLECLKNEKKYSKKEFIGLIEKTSNSKDAYASYIRIKNNLSDKTLCSLEQAEKLQSYLKEIFEKIELLINSKNNVRP